MYTTVLLNQIWAPFHYYRTRKTKTKVYFFSNKILPYIFLCSTGSHLCDTTSCIEDTHIRVETQDTNLSRKQCFGVLMQLHRDKSGIGCITYIKPCPHGRNNNKIMGQQLDDSCRKIQATIVTDDNIHKYI
jgi:hypothetical protein